MDYRDALKDAMKREKVSRKELSRRLGKGDNYINSLLYSGVDMRASLAVDCFRALGYEVIVKRVDCGLWLD